MIRNGFSERACTYFRLRGIDPALAWRCGVREDPTAIVWPTLDADRDPAPRRRRLGDVRGPKVLGLRGRSLGVWWPLGPPSDAHIADVLVCEGESDAMAALSALDGPNDMYVRVASIPGASFPAQVLAAELTAVGAHVAALAFDGDLAGATSADRIARELVTCGVGARILAVPHGEDLASVLGAHDQPRAWLARALLEARPVGVVEAALVAENRWLRRVCLDLQREVEHDPPVELRRVA